MSSFKHVDERTVQRLRDVFQLEIDNKRFRVVTVDSLGGALAVVLGQTVIVQDLGCRETNREVATQALREGGSR